MTASSSHCSSRMSGVPSVSGVRLRLRELRLDVAHRVVAEVAGQAAAKARQPGPQRDLEALLVGGDEVERIAVVRSRRPRRRSRPRCRTEAARAQQRARRQADEASSGRSARRRRPIRAGSCAPPRRRACASFRYSDSGVSRSANASAISGMRL